MSVVDVDADGIGRLVDCDDTDGSVGSYYLDRDCDGVPTTEDCDDASDVDW